MLGHSQATGQLDQCRQVVKILAQDHGAGKGLDRGLGNQCFESPYRPSENTVGLSDAIVDFRPGTIDRNDNPRDAGIDQLASKSSGHVISGGDEHTFHTQPTDMVKKLEEILSKSHLATEQVCQPDPQKTALFECREDILYGHGWDLEIAYNIAHYAAAHTSFGNLQADSFVMSGNKRIRCLLFVYDVH